MGIIHKGIPQDIAMKYAKENRIDTFVETGTHAGATAIWAANRFKHVFTIEYSQKWLDVAKAKDSHGRINWILGDSREQLPLVLKRCRRALIWLDAHWSKDLGYTRPAFGECPLVDEIKAINVDGRSHVIMIDDARLFLTPPPKPHKRDDWPSYQELANLLSVNFQRAIHIVDDVIIAIPRF